MDSSKVNKEILKFIDERNWKQFHSPKNLAIAVGAEAGELLECFQWKTDDEIEKMVSSGNVEDFADEIADIYAYLISLCDAMNINLEEAVANKLEKNRMKYPIEKSFGNSKKYTDI